MRAATGAVVVIDADLQDPPEVIPALVAAWREGFDVVYAQRNTRQGESWVKKATAAGFYRVMQRLGGKVKLPPDTGDFRLMSRRVTDALLKLREQHRFMKGLFAWIGFPAKRGALRPRAARRRRDQVELLEAVELLAGGHHVLHRRAAQGRDLFRLRHRRIGVVLLGVHRHRHAVLRQSGGGLSVADGGHAVPGRGADDDAGHHRRISRAHLQRDQAAPAVFHRAAHALIAEPAGQHVAKRGAARGGIGHQRRQPDPARPAG